MKPWAYKSAEDLAKAGYQFRAKTICPLCGAQIEIWSVAADLEMVGVSGYRRKGPQGFPVFLDGATYQPHLEIEPRHADPPWQPIDGKTASAGKDE